MANRCGLLGLCVGAVLFLLFGLNMAGNFCFSLFAKIFLDWFLRDSSHH